MIDRVAVTLHPPQDALAKRKVPREKRRAAEATNTNDESGDIGRTENHFPLRASASEFGWCSGEDVWSDSMTLESEHTLDEQEEVTTKVTLKYFITLSMINLSFSGLK